MTSTRFMGAIGALTLINATLSAAPSSGDNECTHDPTTPAIIDLGNEPYKGFAGGLYGAGSNQRPAHHENAGRERGRAIEPLGPDGTPDDNGAIVLISIGFSNMTHIWASGAVGEPQSQQDTFRTKAHAMRNDGLLHPSLVVVDGAAGGLTSDEWGAEPPNPNGPPWSVPLNRLSIASLTPAQVQVACVYTATPGPTECMNEDTNERGNAGDLAQHYASIARNLLVMFPNIRQVYFVPREYGGYALTGLNPEPFAYETGFGVKWAVGAQITGSDILGDLNHDSVQGAVVAPWMSYGPYIWANGTTPNSQGLFYVPEDFRPDDRTHPSGQGVDKVSDVFLDFFINDATTRPWFVSPEVCPEDINDDAAVNTQDLLRLLARWGTDGGDVNGDGTTDTDDLLQLLSHWGACTPL